MCLVKNSIASITAKSAPYCVKTEEKIHINRKKYHHLNDHQIVAKKSYIFWIIKKVSSSALVKSIKIICLCSIIN